MTTRELMEKRKIVRPDTARPGQLRPTGKRLAPAILSWNPKDGTSKSSTLAALAYLLMCSGSRPRSRGSYRSRTRPSRSGRSP